VPRRAEGPLSQLLGVVLWVWRRGRPILDRGCGCSPATAMRLCRLTGADPRPGVRGQRRAVGQPPRRSYPTGSPRPGGAVGEDTRLLPRLVSRSFPWAGLASGSKRGNRHTRDYGAACRGPPGLDGRESVGDFLTRSRERRRG